MSIACLGWGSLVWSPRDLPTRGVWQLDGPLLPIEFSRVSADDRVTLAITPEVPEVRSLWVQLTCKSLDQAVRALAQREGIGLPARGLPATVGYWSSSGGTSEHAEAAVVQRFAVSKGLDAVVWTALEPGLSEESRGTVPSVAEIERHLRQLRGQKLSRAEAYVRNAPAAIDTPTRRHLATLLGWHPSDLAYSACGLVRTPA